MPSGYALAHLEVPVPESQIVGLENGEGLHTLERLGVNNFHYNDYCAIIAMQALSQDP